MEALKNLTLWKRACRLSVELYKATASCKEHSFKDQLTRAGLSIASNIAEGYERDSVRARLQYLYVANGSYGEVWTQLMIARSAGFMDSAICKELECETVEISNMIWGLIKHYKKQLNNLSTRPL